MTFPSSKHRNQEVYHELHNATINVLATYPTFYPPRFDIGLKLGSYSLLDVNICGKLTPKDKVTGDVSKFDRTLIVTMT